MLKRGYDFHFHFADFGIRKLMIRFPNGLPNARSAKPYLEGNSLEFLRDKQGPGGILSIEPYLEAGDLEAFLDVPRMIERLLPLRAEILEGDLRPLYLAHLAVASDGNHDPENAREGPVPAGLGELTDAQNALCEWYGITDALLTAAAQNSGPLSVRSDRSGQHGTWVQRQSQAKKDAWLSRLMTDPGRSARRARGDRSSQSGG